MSIGSRLLRNTVIINKMFVSYIISLFPWFWVLGKLRHYNSKIKEFLKLQQKNQLVVYSKYISSSYTAIFIMNHRLLFDNMSDQSNNHKSKCLEIQFTIFQNLKVSPSGQYHFYTMYIPVPDFGQGRNYSQLDVWLRRVLYRRTATGGCTVY